MTKNEQKAIELLNSIKGLNLSCELVASEGGTCGGGEIVDGGCITLSAAQVRFLLKDFIDNNTIFENVDTEYVDIDSLLDDHLDSIDTTEESWPDGISACIDDDLPDELYGLFERISEFEELDNADETYNETFAEIAEEIAAIGGGEYTFHGSVESDGYVFTENADFEISLSRGQALTLLNNNVDIEQFVDESELEDVDYLSELVDKKTLAQYDTMSYSIRLESDIEDSLSDLIDEINDILNEVDD